jgi:hypothetical protein
MDYSLLQKIIKKKSIQPTIINPKSNFVVSTYWWGKGNLNQNTARPCTLFYEEIFSKVQKLCIEYLTLVSRKSFQNKVSNLETNISSLKEYIELIENRANAYNGMIFEELQIDYNDERRYIKAKRILEKNKNNKTPLGFIYKNKEDTIRFFNIMMKEFIVLVKEHIVNLVMLYKELKNLKKQYLIKKNENDTTLTQAVESINIQISTEIETIKSKLKFKKKYTTPKLAAYIDMSLYDIMNKELRYYNPVNYEEMIVLWENACKKINCNYMAVEYPEFAAPGGYQLAINAKPLFIKQALAAVGERAVLYIDGDMFIRKYPKLFDLIDNDFMGRGWNIDPRASWKMHESINYDPYSFETSGGTMWFSQTPEAKQLLQYWIETSSQPANQGKADDRILGLLFNTNKLLCGMKIIQLPIEYLWLTLDYNELMLDAMYDYNKRRMTKSIFIEHTECLTSEETAASSGAANDRTPANYNYIDINMDPVSERLHEYIMFSSADMVDSLKEYLEYMNGAQYFNDGNPILEAKGFINKDHPELNEQPLYITAYKDKYGNTPYFNDDSLTWNEVANLITNKAKKMNIKGLNLDYKKKHNLVEINNFLALMKEDGVKLDHIKILALIVRLLKDDNMVMYNPKSLPGYNPSNYDLIHKLLRKSKTSLEFIITPYFDGKYDTTSANFFYKPRFLINQPIFFKPTPFLIKFLTMFLTLDDMSSYLSYGSYEFMSQVRVGYNFNRNNDSTTTKTTTTTTAMVVGGGIHPKKNLENYNKGIEILYDNRSSNRRITQRRHHKRRHLYKKTKKNI